MGAYSPAPVITPALHARVMREVIDPVMQGMVQEGEMFSGFLYAGLMIDAKGNLKVLESTAAWATRKPSLSWLRLKSDFLTLVEHAVNGTLDQAEAEWDRRAALGVVMAAAGYPDDPRKGDVINGLPPFTDLLEETPRDYHVFHAGTAMKDGKVVTSGGRVLCVTALGDKVQLAQRRAYEIAEQIKFDAARCGTTSATGRLKPNIRGNPMTTPFVAILMGSDSDLPVMNPPSIPWPHLACPTKSGFPPLTALRRPRRNTWRMRTSVAAPCLSPQPAWLRTWRAQWPLTPSGR